MADDIEALYDDLAAGNAEPPASARLVRQLLQRVWEASRDDDPAYRAAGLRVAAALGADGLDVVVTYLGDPDPDIRRRAWMLGVEAGDAGLAIVREAAEADDEDIAVDALRLLTERRDRQSTPMLRRLLESPSARVRGAAVHMLGLVAGMAVVREIEGLSEDDDPEVRRLARAAADRLLGRTVSDSPAARDADDARPAEPDLSPPPPGNDGPPNLQALRAATATSQGARTPAPVRSASEASPASAEPATAAIAPSDPNGTASPSSFQPPAQVAPPEPGTDWEPAHPSPLPAQLPTEAVALLKLLGKVSRGDRARVLEALRHVDAREVGGAVSGYRTGGDPARGRGAAIAATAMGNARWTTALRGFLDDPDVGVRCTALVALGTLGGPSLLPRMAASLRAPEPEVRACACFGVAEIGRRAGDPSLSRHFLADLAGESDPHVKAAHEAAEARLS